MRLHSINVGPQEGVWSDATGEQITGSVVEHYIGEAADAPSPHRRPLSRTTEEEAEGEDHRLSMEYLFGLAQGGYSLHLVTESTWPALYRRAAYTFEGAEDGMIDGNAFDVLQSYQTFVGYEVAPDDWPERFVQQDEDGNENTWERILFYFPVAGCDCPWCGSGTGNEAERSTCDLCEGDGTLYHPYHTAAVYRLVEEDVTRG